MRRADAGRAAQSRRRWIFAGLAAALMLGLLALALPVLAAGGWSVWEVLILLCLLLNLPWMGLAAATGLAGLAIRLRNATQPAEPDAPVALCTAVAVCVRSETMEEVLPPLGRLMDGLVPHGDRFLLAILSDTSDPAHAAAEEAAVAAFTEGRPAGSVLYRRRAENTGYKAGNVMDFLDRHAGDFELMVLLDADSEMAPDAVLRLVRAMQAEPRLAILQHPIAGRPARAAFGRLFNLGHRAGARSWTLGQGWWQGDEGPFWGHNAILRIAPFRQHCRLDPLPDGSTILSHDHVEAARLHGAGWVVRVLPDTREDAGGSLESAPPHLLAFLARDRRWAAGNMQYRHLLRDRTLGPLGRFQMFQALLHYLLAPAWFALLPLAALNAALDAEGTPRGALIALLLLGYSALHLPRLGGHLASLLQAAPGERLAYFRAALSETLFLILFESITAAHNTLIVLSHALGLPHGGWPAQQRAERRVEWFEAARLLWPHTALGLGILALLLASQSGFAILVGIPAVAGLVLAIPFCVLTADPGRGREWH
ncbi:glucans biosynthesis glucosyltransferase MdoH [Roseomonas sp. SSH11]|uniref:Glucans biosynthesis glucosyltransferase H n=1 Tax=Pararoseomonas baculiformis TaxID=2820812 RepID=A0ABS4AG85_9PROT|nr:glucans biosynthesis glucosyltransferase MdoH [Pararoseomonas baculiformis]MBP0445886.1 glucans biosynthesis glucosyltransferase MdoH [Pararoseomonas baculiformis]